MDRLDRPHQPWRERVRAVVHRWFGAPAVPAAPAAPPVPRTPPGPRVTLCFRDGTKELLDPTSPYAAALQELAATLHSTVLPDGSGLLPHDYTERPHMPKQFR